VEYFKLERVLWIVLQNVGHKIKSPLKLIHVQGVVVRSHTLEHENFVGIVAAHQQYIQNWTNLCVLFLIETLLTDVQVESVQCARY
jgi:hypothetical protein